MRAFRTRGTNGGHPLSVFLYGARFRQRLTLEVAFGSHPCSLEALCMRVPNDIPLRCPLPLTVTTVNSVQTLKVVKPWRAWSVDTQVAGYVTSYVDDAQLKKNGLTFLTVKGSGHMVP
jgi:hypothetical protein